MSFISGAFSGKDIYKDDFDDCAKTYDSVATRPLLAKISEEKIKNLELPSNAKILELGCGTGQVTELFLNRFKENRVVLTACDVSDNMLLLAKKRCANYLTRVNFVKGDMAEVLKATPADSFDLIASCWSLEYSDPKVILKEAFRTLKKGGSIAVLVNTADTLSELQKLVTPIVLRNVFCLKNIPPLVVPKSAVWFKKSAEKVGLKTKVLNEEFAEYTFLCGDALVDWMKNGGPSSGFRGALKEKQREKIFSLISKEADKCGGLKITFRYLYYVGVKE